VSEVSEKRAYYKLSFGPNFVGWFDDHEECQNAVPRLVEHLRRLGVIQFVKRKSESWPFNEYEVMAEKPDHDLQIERVEMTPEEYQAIPAVFPSWVSGGEA
jgi:hypothetical protein